MFSARFPWSPAKAGLALALLIIGLAQPALAQLEYLQAGTIRDHTGQPIANHRVMMIGGGHSAPTYDYTNSNGYYELSNVPGAAFTIEPDMPITYFDCAPPTRSANPWAPHTNLDFTITTWHLVSGTVADAQGNMDRSGVEVWVGSVRAATTNSAGAYSFRVYNRGLAPLLVRTGTIVYRKSFHSFSPASQNYDATNGNVTVPATEMDIAAGLAGTGWYSSSWETPGGAGWAFFPKCPTNCVPNNPNIYVSLDFVDAMLSTPVAAANLRLVSTPTGMLPANGVSSASACEAANGYLASFTHPISGCQRGSLQLQYRVVSSANGTTSWFNVGPAHASGTSNLDLNGDGQINLSDISIFAATNGKCQGDPQFLPCADFYPDGCINLSDIAVFSAYFGQGKDLPEIDLFEALRSPGLELTSSNLLPGGAESAIRLGLPEPSEVDLTVFDVSGRTVRHLLEGDARAAGTHTLSWNGRDDRGAAVPRGIYFYQLSSEAGVRTAKVLVLR